MKQPVQLLIINSKPILFYSGYTITTDKKKKSPFSMLNVLKTFPKQDFHSIADVIRMSGQKANWDQQDENWREVSKTLASVGHRRGPFG
jgi:hypothetical protein